MNGGGDTPTLKTRFKLRPAANGAPGSVLCDNYGRMLTFSTGDDTNGCIVVVNGVATLINDFWEGGYRESWQDFGGNEVEPVINGEAYTINIGAVYSFAAESLIVNIGQPLNDVGSYVEILPSVYYRPAGTTKILCNAEGKILIATWGEDKTRQQCIDNDGDFGSIYYEDADYPMLPAENWVESPYNEQRAQLLNDYDFVLVVPSSKSAGNFELLLPDGSLVRLFTSGGANVRIPANVPDFVAP